MPVVAATQQGSPTRETWLALCRSSEAIASAKQSVTYEAPDDRSQTLHVTTAQPPPGCAAVRLPVEAADVIWARLMPPATAQRLRRGLILQGGDTAPAAGSEIIPLEETPRAAPEPTREPSGVQASTPPGVSPSTTRAAWAWRPELWRTTPSPLFATAASWDITTIYVTLPVAADGKLADADRLREFLREAHARGVQVWAVDGDPRMILPAARRAAAERVRAIRVFNEAGERGAPRIAGIQFDIEPYIIPGYALDEEGWHELYVAAIRAFKEAAGDLPIELAVPFWWLDARAGGMRVMDRVSPSIASVAVMDYRTDFETIETLARPWFEWAVQQRHQVRIALEGGQLPDEPRYRFHPAASGTLWQVQVGDTPALVYLGRAINNPAGASFALTSKTSFSASTTTFFGRTEEVRRTLPDLERRLRRYPPFAGLALHEFAAPAAPDTGR